MGIEDFIDLEILYEPAYWILVGMAIVGLALGFGAGGYVGSSEFQVPVLVKELLLIAVFPIAYVIVMIIRK